MFYYTVLLNSLNHHRAIKVSQTLQDRRSLFSSIVNPIHHNLDCICLVQQVAVLWPSTPQPAPLNIAPVPNYWVGLFILMLQYKKEECLREIKAIFFFVMVHIK